MLGSYVEHLGNKNDNTIKSNCSVNDWVFDVCLGRLGRAAWISTKQPEQLIPSAVCSSAERSDETTRAARL